MASLTPETREQAVAIARQWLETPFVHQGRTKGAGVDCAGLVVQVGREMGNVSMGEDPRIDYSRHPLVGNKLFKTIAEHGRLLDASEYKPNDIPKGCVILFWVEKRGRPRHMAISTGPDRMIHAWFEAGKVVETYLGPYWHQRIAAVFDWKEID